MTDLALGVQLSKSIILAVTALRTDKGFPRLADGIGSKACNAVTRTGTDARFGERCKPVYTALATLSANGNDFLDVKTMKQLLELIPDPFIENDLCHEGETAKPLILSKITQGHIFQNIAEVQKVVVANKEAFPMLYRVSCA